MDMFKKSTNLFKKKSNKLYSQGLPQVRILPLLSVVTNVNSLNVRKVQGSACIAFTVLGSKMAAWCFLSGGCNTGKC